MKKIKHPEFTVTGAIMIMIGAVYTYLGYFGVGPADYGVAGIGLALINAGILVLQKNRFGTILLIIILLVLAGYKILLHADDYSIGTFLKLLLGVLSTGSIVWLQIRYHEKKKLT